jgi:hypothetical protein
VPHFQAKRDWWTPAALVAGAGVFFATHALLASLR